MPVRDLLMSAGGASAPAVYVEDVFSTYLYTGNGSTQTITNGIDLADNGGMTWIKSRSASTASVINDTVTTIANGFLSSNATYGAQATSPTPLSSFNSNGFSLNNYSYSNTSGATYASWTFAKQLNFFDVVQYTGTGAVQNIAHNLGSTPGMIIVKETSAASQWYVYHNGLNNGTNPQNYFVYLNRTDAQAASTPIWNNTAPTSTQFTVGTDTGVNASGGTYIAYIFASNAGGFGATGTDNAITCGSFTTDGSGNLSVNLGWEPQYVMIKETDATGSWFIFDVMRGFSNTQDQYLLANTTAAESSSNVNPSYLTPNATGFASGQAGFFAGSASFIYIAIRRPMKPPTTGTSVFSPNVVTPSGATTITTNFPVDLTVSQPHNAGVNTIVDDRLRGDSQTLGQILFTSRTLSENSYSNGFGLDNNLATIDNFTNTLLGTTTPTSYWNFKRAPQFFDEVCYTGTGSATTQTHNLGVAPQLIIVKNRTGSNNWPCYNATLGATNYIYLNNSAAYGTFSGFWNNTSPTASVFSLGSGNANVNGSGNQYVAYLFATCAGVSKVGSYTGNATGQSIACGFGSGGARFVLIKRTDDIGDWYVFDSANGLTSSSSPYQLWDVYPSGGQVTGNNGVYASSGGFTLGATALLTTNIVGASYIFLAIA